MTRRLILAVVAGTVGALAFPPFGYWPLAIVSVAGLSLTVSGCSPRQGAAVGALFGAGLFLPMLHWVSVYVGSLPWLLLAVAELTYLAGLGAILPLLQRRKFASVLTASAWVLQEAVRSRVPFGGFPWGRWAFSQSTSPLKWTAALGGAPLVSFTVALLGALLASSVLKSGALDPGKNRGYSTGWWSHHDWGHLWQRPIRFRGRQLLLAVLVFAISAGLAWPLKPRPHRSIVVAAVQGDVPDRGLEFNARRRQVLDNHVQQTLALAAKIDSGQLPRPNFVLWPENASDIDPTTNADAAQVIQKAVDAVGVPILVGALLDGPGPNHVTNAGIVWQPSTAAVPGPGQRYVKRHPVPYGEYIPLRSIARKISSKVDLVPRDMIAGRGEGRLDLGGIPIGDVICFEVAYDALVRSSVAHGAQLLVVQTNNATFGHTGETYQQLAMSRLRAVETGRTVVQVATSGKSAIISPDGSIQQQSGKLFTAAVLEQRVSLSSAQTIATRLGAWVEVVLGAWSVLALLACLGSQRAGRLSAGRTPPAMHGGGADELAGSRPALRQATGDRT